MQISEHRQLPAIGCPYDQLAPEYDTLWSTPDALAEDREIMQRIAYTGGRVLDIGCGTGLFLDHHPEAIRSRYVGVDPSAGMLHALRRKHPAAAVFRTSLERFAPSLRLTTTFDLILSLYGSPSYIQPEALLRTCKAHLKPGGKLFLMFYAPGYSPATHRYITDPPIIHHHEPEAYGTPTPFGNYVIVES